MKGVTNHDARTWRKRAVRLPGKSGGGQATSTSVLLRLRPGREIRSSKMGAEVRGAVWTKTKGLGSKGGEVGRRQISEDHGFTRSGESKKQPLITGDQCSGMSMGEIGRKLGRWSSDIQPHGPNES